MAESLDTNVTEDAYSENAYSEDSKPETPTTIYFSDSKPHGLSAQINILGSDSAPPPNIQVGSTNNMTVFMGPQPRRTQCKNIKRKKPLTTSTAEPTSNHFDIVAAKIGSDWKRLGRCMNLSDGELDTLKLDYKAEGQHEVAYQMLRKWKSMNHPVTLQQLAQKCDSIGRGDLADDLH